MNTLKQQTKPSPEAIQNALLILWRACERIKKEEAKEMISNVRTNRQGV
ncbi:hypothetical protein [Shimazuella alba]|uniref:Uncharacterized protein n=1 Tax=Shimazuella alba TaxID=2690964 RepID=A0A6I4VPM1_9BACL|nr:hypothetical protein [Shimazuella alba]MXQ52348.1 hypothetical protein [Shimazuella alba]